jgi:hypothetical protein
MNRSTRLRTLVVASALLLGFNAVATVTGFYQVVLDVVAGPSIPLDELVSMRD